MSATVVHGRKRRRWLAPVIVLGSIAVLLVVAFFVGERLARDYAADLVRAQLTASLGIPAAHPVDVDFGPGSLVLQALGGTIEITTVTIDDVQLGPAVVDLSFVATGVPLDTSKPVSTFESTVVVGEDALAALAPGVAGGAITGLEIVGGQIVVESSWSIFGVAFPITVSLEPSAVDGALTLDVTDATVSGSRVAVDDIKAGAFGPDAAALAAPRTLCLAEFLPAPLVLTQARIVGSDIVVGFSGTDLALGGDSFATKGTCPAAGQ